MCAIEHLPAIFRLLGRPRDHFSAADTFTIYPAVSLVKHIVGRRRPRMPAALWRRKRKMPYDWIYFPGGISFRGGGFRLEPAQPNEILLSTIVPSGAIVIFSFSRIIFDAALIHPADTMIDILQSEILTAQTDLLYGLHGIFSLIVSLLLLLCYPMISKKLSRSSPL